MANFNSVGIANGLAFPVSKNSPRDYYGRVRVVRWVYTALGTEASGDTITLANLPPTAKVVGGTLVYGALGTGVTSSVGLVNGLGTLEGGAAAGAATGTEFLSAGATATAGATALADTLAKKYGYVIANPAAAATGQANQTTPLGDTLILTIGGAGLTAGIIISGQLLIVVD